MTKRYFSLKDIAAETGASPSTVSRVINGYKKGFSVKPELRSNIMSCIKRNGYKPNPFLRAMRAKRTMLVDILFVDTFPLANRGVIKTALMKTHDILEEKGFFLNYSFTKSGTAFPLPLWMMSGIIIPDLNDISVLDKIKRGKLPFVSLNGIYGEFGAAVVVDEENCANLALDYLFSLGHRKIAYANSQTNIIELSHYSVKERHRVYLKYMKDKCCPVMKCHNSHNISAVDFLKESVLKGGATAVLAYDHTTAMHILNAAWRLGIPVPEKLSVMCFNDEYPANISVPPLTCVNIPSIEMGIKTAYLLLKQMEEGVWKKCRVEKVAGTLVIRESACRQKQTVKWQDIIRYNGKTAF
jgi:LacI family transcriptional regulator